MWNRRKFVRTTSVIAGGSSCGLLPMTSCTPVKYLSGELNDNTLVVSKLDWGESEFVLVQNPELGVPIFVKHTGNGYLAVYLECTHKKCEVRPNAKTLKCPCHGSEFDHTGKVLQGPAMNNLESFEVREDQGAIYIQ